MYAVVVYAVSCHFATVTQNWVMTSIKTLHIISHTKVAKHVFISKSFSTKGTNPATTASI